jgi:biotin carboxyl carrier protein
MSTYVALLDGGAHEERVEVTREAPGVYRVAVRGEVHRVDAFRHDAATMNLLLGAESWSVQLDERAAGTRVEVRGVTYPVEVLDERGVRVRRGAERLTLDGRQPIAAPLPCKVVKVLARAGEQVRAGQGVALVEALEMETELRSPRDGRVVEVAVAEGQAVGRGAFVAAVE